MRGAANPAHLLCLLLLGGLSAATYAATEGQWVYPLDDAYIHLAVAQTLLQSGTWGINPGQFASASSSPLWTLLLAALGAPLAAPLLLNLLAAFALIELSACWLADAGLPPSRIRWLLLALVLVMPVPFLVGLGMEHLLHLLLILALVRTTEQGSLQAIALLSGLALMTRYESGIVVLALTAVLLRQGRLPQALAALAGTGAAGLGFALWSLAQGGLPLPGSVLKKAPMTDGVWAGLIESMEGGGAVLVLAAAAALGSPGSARTAARAQIFVLSACGHLLLARVGWFYRYEAWLVGWGLLTVGLLPLRPLLALPLGLPLAVRACQALGSFAEGARFQALVDVALARWVAATLPQVPLAVHDLGAVAYMTENHIVDVGGIGTDALTRQHLSGTLTPQSVGELLDREAAVLAITGRDWLQGPPPPQAEEIASLYAMYAGREYETVLWSLDPQRREALVEALRTSHAHFSSAVRLVVRSASTIDLQHAELRGAAVQAEEDRLAFYTNGSAEIDLTEAGTVRLTAWGSLAQGQGPRFQVTLGDWSRTLEADTRQMQTVLGEVKPGDRLKIEYTDDAVGEDGEDRNLFVRLEWM